MTYPETKEQWIYEFKKMGLINWVWWEKELKYMWFSDEDIKEAKWSWLICDHITILCTKLLPI